MKSISNRGFTLVEALVALVILSIGLLGVAAMQLKALQGAHMGYQRALASIIAIDVQEFSWELLASTGTCPPDDDLTGWLGTDGDGWSGLLPSVENASSISGGPDTGCVYSVTLTWGDSRLADGESVGTFDYEFKLPSG
ncbi:prepilin-type N-terminal cleavage/methylation domain-containing protein [Halomonas sp. 25-S5]|uniref:type IV pilus modification PilV family protein n=1 Tax=Halomonas sp. 25-S5 TaxID=2994065 RepID=UPI0024696421|nr:prepilin-type N-terminal cleavage/methylation domain-containing protein [Halomonas sp. 25-S5]